MKKNIYALIVGIDDYPSCPLNGCVADSKKMLTYLESDLVSNHYTVDFKIINDGGAKRMDIIKAFQNHLGKARKDDIALFYFSGHGAQELADQTIWHGEGNKKLEGLVCHDSLSTSLLLADKELRFLINSVSENDAHVLTIFDCCHSGGNTRGFVEEKMTKRQFADPRMGQEFPKRAWNQFFFNGAIDINRLKNEPLNEVMPQGNHIQLAACQSDQSAYETNIQDWGKGGVFTYNLIQVLNRSKGMVSYYDLKSRIFHFIKNQYNQTPTIYVKGSKRGDIYKNFLGGETASVPLYGNLVFNKKQQNWVLDMGAIHGISEQAETVNIEVTEQQPITAEITKVNAADTILKLPADAVLDTKIAYKAYVHPFKSAPIGVFINGDAYEQETKDKLVDLITKKGSNINLVAEEKTADYTIQLDKWHYSITLPNDPYRPLVLPVEQLEDGAAQEIFDQLYHISQWEFAKELHNSDPDSKTHLNASAIQVDMIRVDDGKQVVIDNDEINMHLSTVDADGEINIRLTNTTNRKLYVAALYMGVNFEVLPDFLEAGVQMLEPKGFVDLMIEGDVNIPYYLDDCKRLFNWKKSTSYFKIIMNTQSFDVNNLLLDSLEDPSKLFEEKMRGVGKGIGRRKKSAANAEQWTTRLLSFNVHNPDFNRIDLEELKSHLQTAAAPFVAGLYLEQSAGLSGGLSLKKGFKIKKSDQEKGFLYDAKLYIANSISREIRRFRYEKQLMLNPKITRIVSEGDSWFQYPHPKVLDIIDHLYKDYAIFSLGAGGDELKHFYDSDEFIKTVERVKPKFLLLSGGGNDILGEEFEGFLRADIGDDLPLEYQGDLSCFMDATFYKKLDYITNTYRTIFERMQHKFPDIPVLIHGYDYAIPLESTEKGWLGRYMIARNINNQVKRRKLIKYLVDELNDRLSVAALAFPMVHYIDCRGTVTDDSWWDEIHPVSEGFELVAGHFLKKLRELEG